MGELNIIQYPIKNWRNYGVKRDGDFTSIEVHSIGTAQNTGVIVAQTMNASYPFGTVHAIMDAEKEHTVYQLLPDDNIAWADAGYGNHHSITFEIMESDHMTYQKNSASFAITNKEKFNQDVQRGYETAVLYCAMKCKQYGFNPLEKMSNGLYRVYSHNEAREKGLASSHVDPTHYWAKSDYGYTMDTFRAAVKECIDTGKVPNATAAVYYRVRKTWADEKSQLGAYLSLDNAKANCPSGYSVFDNDGKVIYTVEATGTQP